MPVEYAVRWRDSYFHIYIIWHDPRAKAWRAFSLKSPKSKNLQQLLNKLSLPCSVVMIFPAKCE